MNLEDELYAMALDVIGKAVFNYEFGALARAPLIKPPTGAESRNIGARFRLQYWNIPAP